MSLFLEHFLCIHAGLPMILMWEVLDQKLMTLLSVSEGRGRKEEITGEAKTWLISIACMKPKDLGYAAETWTTSALTKHINKVAKDAGYERLSTITEASVYRILDKANIKPFRIRYSLMRREISFHSMTKK